MLQQLFKKWWILLVQGILLIILSFFIFNNSVEVLAGLSLWVAFLTIVTGILGVISWFVADKSEREGMSLLWSIITIILGILMFKNVLATMIAISVLFGLWMMVTGLWLTQKGWSLKETNSFGWVILVAGVLSIIAGIMMTFNVKVGATGISVLIGMQVLLAGIAFVILAFAKKSLMTKISGNISTIRSKYN